MAERPEAPPSGGLNANALTVLNAARLLTKASGQPIAADAIQADLAAGAPVNVDGTINLLHYAAWLVREMAEHD